jgi:Phage major capsid protein E
VPSPTLTDVHVQAALTNVAVAYLQSEDNYVADKVFPMVPVQFQANKYFVWSKADFFRDEAQLRADAVESAGSGVNLTTQSYAAEVWALHQDIGPQVRANADPAVDVDVTITRVLMQKLLIRRDRFFMTKYMTTSVWGTDNTGTAASSGGSPGTTTPVFWDDDANGDPFTDLALGQTTILTNTGYLPNMLLMSWNVYQALRKHPLVIDRIKYTNPAYAGTVTPQLLAEAFDIAQIVVSKAVYNSAQENLSATMAFVAGKNALLVYRPPAPGLMVASAGYTFGWTGFTGLNNLGIRVSQIPMNWLGLGTVRTEGEMAFDMQVVGKDLGYFFSGITQI